MDKLTFFGMELSWNGISCTEEKVKADLATVSEPLRRLTKSGTPFVFGGEEKKAFQELKDRLARADTLGYFDKDSPTQVLADASPVGLEWTESHLLCKS